MRRFSKQNPLAPPTSPREPFIFDRVSPPASPCVNRHELVLTASWTGIRRCTIPVRRAFVLGLETKTQRREQVLRRPRWPQDRRFPDLGRLLRADQRVQGSHLYVLLTSEGGPCLLPSCPPPPPPPPFRSLPFTLSLWFGRLMARFCRQILSVSRGRRDVCCGARPYPGPQLGLLSEPEVLRCAERPCPRDLP